MTGRSKLLGALLGLQLIVIGAVWFLQSGAGESASGTLVSFSPEAADELRVGASDQEQPVVIRRTDAGWQLADGLPADAAKVDEMLERLAGLRAPWAVATSASARTRFEVTPEQHQRHLEVRSAGETVAELYLGTSPGYQRVHARAADADAVFSVELSNYQLPAEAADWLDKGLLQPEGELSAVARLDAWQLRRDGDGWQLDDQAADADAAGRLVRRFAELRVTGAVATPADAAEPVARFRIDDGAGNYVLSVYQAEDEESYVVASSRRDGGYFGLAGYLAEQLLVEREALLPAPVDEPSQEDGDSE